MKTRGKDILNKFQGGEEDDVDNFARVDSGFDYTTYSNKSKQPGQVYPTRQIKFAMKGNANSDFIGAEQPSRKDPP